MVKKVYKAKDTGLQEGEEVLAAISKNDDGAIMKAAVSGGVDGLLGVFAGRKMQNKTDSKAEADNLKGSDMTAKIPAGLGFFAVTDKRFLIYSHNAMSGNAKQLVAELPKGSVKIESITKGKLASRVVMTFSDGGRKAFDIPKMNDVEAFQAVL